MNLFDSLRAAIDRLHETGAVYDLQEHEKDRITAEVITELTPYLERLRKAERAVDTLADAHRRAEKAEAALTRVRQLADRWVVLRAHGGAAYELRATLDEPHRHAEKAEAEVDRLTKLLGQYADKGIENGERADREHAAHEEHRRSLAILLGLPQDADWLAITRRIIEQQIAMESSP